MESPASEIKELHADGPLRLVYEHDNSDILLISFSHRSYKAPPDSYYARPLARKLGIAALGIINRENNWFASPSLYSTIEKIRPLFMRFPHRVTYGASMGGYAAVKFAAAFQATAVISFSPQDSIAPADVGKFDKRFIADYKPELHDSMSVRSSDVCGNVFIFSDSHFSMDWLHVERICCVYPECHAISMPLTRHGANSAFASSSAMRSLIDFAVAGDVRAVRELASKRRRLLHSRRAFVLEKALRQHPAWGAKVLDWARASIETGDLLRIFMFLGDNQRVAHRWEAARTFFLEALALEPTSLVILLRLAQVEMLAGNADAQLRWASEALRVAPRAAHAHADYALALIAAGGPIQDAEASISKAITIHPHRKDTILKQFSGVLAQKGFADRADYWLGQMSHNARIPKRVP